MSMICDVRALFIRLDWLWDSFVYLSGTVQNSPSFLCFSILGFCDSVYSFYFYGCIFLRIIENFELSVFEEYYSNAK